jgi:hypothetical protein
MSFLMGAEAQFRRRSAQPDALHEWRDAEQLVRERWHEYCAAGPDDGRLGAFAAYMAALHAEEAAARQLASVTLADAA